MTEPAYQPHYRQIEQVLRERIATLRPGERLPSDAELCAEFGVSRMTARNAMQRLAEDGLIAREPGRGSFVASPPAHRRANRLMTFTQEMRRAGRVPNSRVLTRVIRPSTHDRGRGSRHPRPPAGRAPAPTAAGRRRADRTRIDGADRRLCRRRDDGGPRQRLAPRDARHGPGTSSVAGPGRSPRPPPRPRMLACSRPVSATRCWSSGGSSSMATAGGSRRPSRATPRTATVSSCSSRSKRRMAMWGSAPSASRPPVRPTDDRRLDAVSAVGWSSTTVVASGRIRSRTGGSRRSSSTLWRLPTGSSSPPASSTSTSMAGVATTRWAIARPSTGWRAGCCDAA